MKSATQRHSNTSRRCQTKDYTPLLAASGEEYVVSRAARKHGVLVRHSSNEKRSKLQNFLLNLRRQQFINRQRLEKLENTINNFMEPQKPHNPEPSSPSSITRVQEATTTQTNSVANIVLHRVASNQEGNNQQTPDVWQATRRSSERNNARKTRKSGLGDSPLREVNRRRVNPRRSCRSGRGYSRFFVEVQDTSDTDTESDDGVERRGGNPQIRKAPICLLGHQRKPTHAKRVHMKGCTCCKEIFKSLRDWSEKHIASDFNDIIVPMFTLMQQHYGHSKRKTSAPNNQISKKRRT